ncbi:transcription factor of the MADS box [Coemansia sp. RSA 552]|nr:transcription factor of the MADS box [Coemansia sp. RSA 552]
MRLGYVDSLSISSTETAAVRPEPSASLAATHLLKMNPAFMPDDAARLNGGLLLDQQTAVRLSSGSESRTQTPGAKRSREDDESEAGESEGNSRATGEPAVPEKRSGRRKIKIEYIEDKSRRHITFSKRKAGIMKKAYELSTLTGTQVLLLVVSETGLVYTFTTPKLQPIVTQAEGKNLIQACLSMPDQPGERVAQPVPTESNSYMSQPRHALSADDRKPNAVQQQQQQQQQQPPPPPYLQYPYGQSAVAQAMASSAVQYAAVPGYASYPASASQSQHHSPAAIPSLAAYHHAAYAPQPYAYAQAQQPYTQPQDAEPPTSNPSSVSVALAAVAAAAGSQQQQQQQPPPGAAVPYMPAAAAQYWQPPDLASPQNQPQLQPQQPPPSALASRSEYAGSG